jgi:hypothetical protein
MIGEKLVDHFDGSVLALFATALSEAYHAGA